jgi:hypothetical protein
LECPIESLTNGLGRRGVRRKRAEEIIFEPDCTPPQRKLKRSNCTIEIEPMSYSMTEGF